VHFRFRLHVQMSYYSLAGKRVLEQHPRFRVFRAVHRGSNGSEMVFLTTRGKNVGVLWKARARGKVIGQGSEAKWNNFRALLEACLVAKNFAKFFNILRHIESLDVCMKH
jgi:hypothetical protein